VAYSTRLAATLYQPPKFKHEVEVVTTRVAIASIVSTLAYWYFAGHWASHASYVWAADLNFGVTDQTSPWPWLLVIGGYIAFVIAFFMAIRAKRKKQRRS
jgi:hypothetical protein